ncbi:glycerophosphodiester phosphodiesterase family protein [Sphingomonas kaistensis]|uniref:Glycerophosphodiester phosphodiesterase family protein n=1 Tax=Sphingomonas kaistensis TaxID=298708 RepID=A0ABZ2G078_9SPHN
MSRSATDRLFAGPAGFAHRGRHGPGVPENSLAAFRAAIAAGAGIECDLRLSSDGSAMIHHDSTLERMCGISAQTESLPAASLMALPLAGGDERIPWLGSLLDLAAKTPLLLELKVRAGSPPPPVDLLCRTVAHDLARHEGPVGVMSFDPRVGAWFARHAPALPRGLVIADATPAWHRFAMIRLARPTFLAVETTAAARPWVAKARRRWPVACWTVRDITQKKALSDRVDALIWEGDGRP